MTCFGKAAGIVVSTVLHFQSPYGLSLRFAALPRCGDCGRKSGGHPFFHSFTFSLCCEKIMCPNLFGVFDNDRGEHFGTKVDTSFGGID